MSLKILHIEDDYNYSNYIKCLFLRYSKKYSVQIEFTYATSMNQAKRYSSENFDLIISDMWLSRKIHWIETFKLLAQMFPPEKLVIVTGISSMVIKKEVDTIGFLGIYFKDDVRIDFPEKIINLLKEKKHEKNNINSNDTN